MPSPAIIPAPRVRLYYAATLTLFGIIHSPFADGRMFFPWSIGNLPPESNGRSPFELMTAYLLLTITFAGWGVWYKRQQNHSSPYAPAIGAPPGEPPNADVPAAESEGPALPANWVPDKNRGSMANVTPTLLRL